MSCGPIIFVTRTYTNLSMRELHLKLLKNQFSHIMCHLVRAAVSYFDLFDHRCCETLLYKFLITKSLVIHRKCT